MVTKEGTPAPQTLMDAHLLLAHLRPRSSAAPNTWLAFYRRGAAVYAEVAEIDRGHHHEALYWADRERRKANDLAKEIAANPQAAAKRAISKGGESPGHQTLITEL